MLRLKRVLWKAPSRMLAIFLVFALGLQIGMQAKVGGTAKLGGTAKIATAAQGTSVVALAFGEGTADSNAPSASTTYFWSGFSGALSGSNASENNLTQFIVPVTGTVVAMYESSYVGGTTSSGQNAVITLRKNGADTSITVSDAFATASGSVASDTVNTVAVTAGDKLSFKIVTPAWTVTPTGVRLKISLRITV